MKAKLKSANGFTRFMLAHGEKLGMAAVVAVAGLLIWKSLGRERLDASKQPDNLNQAAQSAETKVTNMSWEAFPPEEKILPEEVIVDVNAEAQVVDADDAWVFNDPDPPVSKPLGKRKDPELLTVEDIEVAGGAGLLASADPQVLKQRKLAFLKEQQEREKEAEEERERLEREQEEGGGRGRGRGRGEGGYGGEFGGRGGGYGGMGDGSTTKDGALVLRPMGGAPLAGGEDIRNSSWVIVKAKVPIRAQFKNYEKALKNAPGYSMGTDTPIYKGYQVERCEVTDDGDGEWVLIEKAVTAKELVQEMETWPIQTPDLINPKYNHPLLTFPLPPMVLRAWGDEVTHSDLPIPTPEDLAAEMMPDLPKEKKEKTTDGEGDSFDEATAAPTVPGGYGGEFGGRGAYGGAYGGEYGGRGGYGGEFGGRGPGGGLPGAYGGGMDMGMGGRGAYGGAYGGRGMSAEMMGGGAGSVTIPDVVWDMKTKYYLFRYFDGSAEPGKRYRYRVRLAVADVNADPVPEMYLSNDVVDRRKANPARYRFTPWSDASDVAVVPQPGLVFIAGAKPANLSNYNAEPEAKLLIKSLDSQQVAEVALAEYFLRGSVLNLFAQKAQIIWSETFQALNRDGEPQDSPTFNFSTGLTLLDFEGGEPLQGKKDLAAPTRALLMDSAGRIMIESELDDREPVRIYDAYMEAAADAKRRAEERDDNRGGGGRGGYGGGGGRRGR